MGKPEKKPTPAELAAEEKRLGCTVEELWPRRLPEGGT